MGEGLRYGKGPWDEAGVRVRALRDAPSGWGRGWCGADNGSADDFGTRLTLTRSMETLTVLKGMDFHTRGC